MAMTVSSIAISAAFDCRVRNTFDLVSTDQSTQILKNFTDSLTHGTGADQVNQVWSDDGQVAIGVVTQIDLVGSLTDYYGNTISFTTIKGMLIHNNDATATLWVGGGTDGAGTNAFVNWIETAATHVIIPPGGVFMLFTPDATGFACAGGSDILGLEESTGAATCDYEIVLLGEV